MSDDADQQRKADRHKAAMQKQKARVDAHIEAADLERGVAVLITGNGKGKTSSAFGMVMRALGYGMKVGVVQFIKGQQLSGEEIYLRDHCPQVAFHQMGTGFTWIPRTAAPTSRRRSAPGRWPDPCWRTPVLTWWYWTN